MMKAIAFVTLGIVIGVLATLNLRISPNAAGGDVDRSVPESTSTQAVAATVSDSAASNPGSRAVSTPPQLSRVGEAESESNESAGQTRTRYANVWPTNSDDVVTELIAAGFNAVRAEEIKELYIDVIAERAAEEESVDGYRRSMAGRLREKLGDAEFARYLDATNMVNGVEVWDIVENSPAAMAGLSLGDRIISYDGNRVFDWREINGVDGLSTQGQVGEAVIVDVIRDGEPLQILLPRGQLEAALFSGGTVKGLSCEQDPDQWICSMELQK